MDINHQAPLVARKEIVIQASPESIWNLLADINAWSHWQPDISIARLEGPLAVGSVFRWKAGGLNITSTLQVVEPYQRIGWAGAAIGMQARHLWVLRPHANGTLVITEESLAGWLARLLRAMNPKFLDESMEASLKTLQRHAEGSGKRV